MRPQVTVDATSNSPCVSQLGRKFKAIWIENLVIYLKSLRAFFQGPFQIIYYFSQNLMYSLFFITFNNIVS